MEPDELIGALVDDRYKVLDAMASGSMGIVYKAERVPVGKLVAIKFLHATFANDSEFLARFERETRVMSKLAHPNCVSVVDFGVWEGAPYLVMEYVAGTTLRSIIDIGPLVPMRALGICRQIASGLAHAHSHGIVHRDVKPANIMISDEIGAGEHVRILDFGLARLRGAVGRDATQSNVVVGTPNYMAPEQTVGGGTIDARTDVYAVGIVLFEMIVGDRPFQAEDTLALLGMHRAAPIPKLVDRVEGRVEIPNGVQAVIERALAKSPEDRFQSAIELAQAVDAITSAITMSLATGDSGRVSSRREAGVAPTMLDIGAASNNSLTDLTVERVVAHRRAKPASSMVGALLAVAVLGGGAAAAWYAKGRGASSRVGSTAPVLADAGGSALAHVVPASADAAIVPPDSGAGSGAGSADLLAAGSGSGSAITDVGSAGSDTAGEIELEPDPVSADHVVPESEPTEDEDEAADAPATDEEVEKQPAPPAPKLARTIHDAVVLIKQGERDLALASLLQLKRRNPRSAYVPYLLGNLYFEKRWWSVALSNYRLAIKKNGGYRKNGVLIGKVVRMLASNKTASRASAFLRGTIGHPALTYVRYAAGKNPNPTVRKRAATLAKQIR
ncbi:MAG: protein kinase [Kofleriaceae bacterium]